MRIKKKKTKPILARARIPAERAAETRFQRLFSPVVSHWRIIGGVALGVVVLGGAVGGYFWYKHDREIRAARAYGMVLDRAAERMAAAAKKAGPQGNVDEKPLDAELAKELGEFVDRFGSTGAGLAAIYELASLRFEQGNYAEARELFARVEKDGRGLDQTLAGKGVADCDKAVGKYDAAITGYKAIFDRSGDKFPAVAVAAELAGCYAAVGKEEEAAKYYQYVLDYHRLSPFAGEAAVELAKIRAAEEAAK
jgi:tetratricopeptide (TPR) repeat protein